MGVGCRKTGIRVTNLKAKIGNQKIRKERCFAARVPPKRAHIAQRDGRRAVRGGYYERTIVPAFWRAQTAGMARYSSLLGRRVHVQYRAGEVNLPATGMMAADSGKSIFLEERFEKSGSVRSFRWEIPYQYIVQIAEIEESRSAPQEGAAGENGDEAGFLPVRRTKTA